jgi:hypothetical protein
MTYPEIEAFLKERGAVALLTRLREAVRDETDALMAHSKSSSAKARRAKEQSACEFYAQDITNELDSPTKNIFPDSILCLRRQPTAWAIARKIEELELQKDENNR